MKSIYLQHFQFSNYEMKPYEQHLRLLILVILIYTYICKIIPNLCIILATFLLASFALSSVFAPVHKIFPVLNTSTVALGTWSWNVAAGKRRGLYLILIAFSERAFKLTFVPRFARLIILCTVGVIPLRLLCAEFIQK